MFKSSNLSFYLLCIQSILFIGCGPAKEVTTNSDASNEANEQSEGSIDLAATPEPKVQSNETVVATVEEISSYGIGFNLGTNLVLQKDFEPDMQSVLLGISDAMKEQVPRVTPKAIQTALEEIQIRTELAAKERDSANKLVSNTFLSNNSKRKNVVTTASGLQYEILESASREGGAKPSRSDMVKVHYHGTLKDGTIFDSSIQRNEPITLGVDSVILGWTEALQLMTVGDKWKLYIPPALGYGSRGSGQIPPNSILVFEISLLEINPEA